MPVQDALAAAGQLFNAGRLAEAENICRQIIKARPKLAEAHNILGVTLHRLGRSDEAVAALKAAIRFDGTIPNYHSNLGEIERNLGHLDEAEKILKRAIALNPNAAEAINNLGIVYYDKGEYETARDHYLRSIELNPNYAEAHNNLGNALRALEQTRESLDHYERAVEINASYAEAYNNMGTALRDLGRRDDAETALAQAATIRPDYLEAYNNLAMLYLAEDRHDDALHILADALRRSPTHVPTLVGVARAQLARGAAAAAEQAVREALRIDPDSAEAHSMMGQVFHDTDRLDKALASFRKALELKPDMPEALNMLGVTLKATGHLDEAREVFLKALENRPSAAGTYSNIVDLEKFTTDSPILKAMLDVLDKADEPEADRYIPLHFALGKAHEDIGDPEKALHHYVTGARLRRAQLDYDEASTFAFFDEIIATFDEAYFANRPFAGNPTTLPLFIVGMPRSGSTLTEQIISAHPDVFGAGEIKTLSQAIGALRRKYPTVPKFPAMAKAMKPAHFNAVAEQYLATVTALSPTASRITDKLLTNYYFVGPITTLFPNAKIIHTMRNPVDTCLSAFSKLFKDDMPHSYDLAEIGRYYRKYEELMAHWRKVLPPGVMLDVQYEDVVADIEPKAREIIAFCGLPWDDRCLQFHESTRPVKTASVSQVRKPLYATSVERWKRYGKRLGPLLDALGIDPDKETVA